MLMHVSPSQARFEMIKFIVFPCFSIASVSSMSSRQRRCQWLLHWASL